MSPFSCLLTKLRHQARLRQSELAELVGYEQSYLSALEVGVKGPPTEEFLSRLVAALSLDAADVEQLREAAEASQRKIQIPSDVPPSIYMLCHELRKQIEHLHPTQVEAILAILRLSSSLKSPEYPVRRKRIRRSADTYQQEAQM